MVTRSRAVALLAPVALLLAGVPAITSSAAAAPPPTASAADAAARSAEQYVARRPAALHAGPDDAFVRRPVISAAGIQYVPYERTYHSLPVIGGDFVLVIDKAGKLAATSVAQRHAISGLSTAPKVTRARAEKVAAGELKSVAKTHESRLVVYALGGAPRLAWESNVSGTGVRGASELTVYVDATTGAILDRDDHVQADEGHAGINGPNPLQVPARSYNYWDTTVNPPVEHTRRVLSHAYDGYSCNFSSVYRTDPVGPVVWGNSDATNVETACVDAMFVASTQHLMLQKWLGRDGMDGEGGGFPMYVGLDEANAYFHHDPFDEYIKIGHVQGRWVSTLDVVGHENGHGIDYHTPGGKSQNGTAEFIADVFGAATEWFANESAPFDTPDYSQGDFSRLGTREMFAKACYTAQTPTMEVHAAAGVGDHWFYLMSEGTNPSNGQPVSQTCDGSRFRGLGIQTALKVLYHAMLMKTSDSSYQAYRKWTLIAAKNLYPDSCAVYNTVEVAWNAVSVWPQPGEPGCQMPASKVISSEFDGYRDDIAVLPGAPWDTIPVAYATNPGNFTITNVASPEFTAWAQVPGVRVVNGDFNNDGRKDMALLPGPDTAWWRTIPVAFAELNGKFRITNMPSDTFAGGWAQVPGVRVVSGDFNSDKRTDIALLPGPNTPWWYTIPVAFSNGDGSFQITNTPANEFAGGWAQVPGVRVVDGDFNNDGRTDIALMPGPNMSWWYTIPVAFSNGDGTFRITNMTGGVFASGWAQVPGVKVVSGDFNKDQRTDLALVPGPNTPWWYTIPVAFSNGDGSFRITNSPVGDYAAWAQVPGVRVVAGDFNRDQRTDLVLLPGPGTDWWSTIPVAFANGDGTFRITNAPADDFVRGWGQQPGAQVVAGDFNADGSTDLALTGPRWWTKVPVAQSNHDGTFTTMISEGGNFAYLASF